MGLRALDIPALAEDILSVDGLFDRRDGHVTLALYRLLLAEGEPVSEERLAAATGRTVSEIADWLRGTERAELYERGQVVAFQGLSLRPTKHLFEVNCQTLYTWCAGDTLMIGDLLSRAARVRSTDPITGRTVSLTVKNGAVSDVEPSTAMQSMLRPDADGAIGIGDGVVPDACGPINFFATEEAGRAFTERVEGTFLLTIEQGLELARLMNRALFGSALTRRRG